MRRRQLAKLNERSFILLKKKNFCCKLVGQYFICVKSLFYFEVRCFFTTRPGPFQKSVYMAKLDEVIMKKPETL